MPLIAIIAISTWISLICAGSRVNSGSMKLGRGAFTTKLTQSAGMSMRGSVVVLPSTHLVDLRDHDAARKSRGLDDGRRVFGVGAGVEVALRIGRLRGDQRHLGREVDEVAREQFEVGVDRTDLDAAARHQLGQARALRPREAEVEPRRRCRSRRGPDARAGPAPTAPCAGRGRAADRPAPAPWPGSRPASGCCLRGRRGRRARSPLRARCRWLRASTRLPVSRAPSASVARASRAARSSALEFQCLVFMGSML